MMNLRIGTRSSPLALIQAKMVQDALKGLCQVSSVIVPIQTTGDRILDRHLSQLGGKGLFTLEIEEGLRDGSLDIAVHSMKDMPPSSDGDLVIQGMLKRERPEDAFISSQNLLFKNLPLGAKIGTASLRRRSQLLSIRPDLEISLLRGNVATRLDKLRTQGLDGTLLGYGGLKRLGQEHLVTEILDPHIMVPAPGQGAIGIQIHAKRNDLIDLLEKINHVQTFQEVSLERRFLEGVEGSCGVPVGVWVQQVNEGYKVETFIGTSDGRRTRRHSEILSQDIVWDALYHQGQEARKWLQG